MRYIQNILFLIIILSFSLILSQDATDDVIINRISNDPVEGQGDQTSSMAGGALFYIRGSGFDQMVSNNLVFMGPYQANVIGVNDAYLIFESVPQTTETPLKVSVVVIRSQTNIKKYSKCNTDCNVYYSWWRTTQLRRISPRSASPTEYVTFLGLPESFTSSTGIEDIKIGQFVCDRVALDDMDYVPWDSYSKFKCRVAPEMISGYYNSSLKVKQYGLASKYQSFQGLDNNGYLSDFKCLPSIINISSNIGSPNGQIIDIYGYGFSSNITELEVKAGDYDCKVISADTYQIKCEVKNIPLNQSIFIGGTGVERRMFDGSNSRLFYMDGGFQNMIWSKNYTIPLLQYSIFNEIDRLPTDESEEVNILESWECYFLAPITGKYRFFLTSDDYSELYLSNTSNSSNISFLNRIAYTPYRNYEAPYYLDTQRSDYISLTAGQYYLFNAFRNQGGGGSFMWAGVEVESKTRSPKSIVSVQMINITTDAINEIQELIILNWGQIKQFKIIMEAKDIQTGKTNFYRETSPMNYNIDVNTLYTQVRDQLGWHSPQITRYSLFSNGSFNLNTNFNNLTRGYLWRINFTSYRDEYLPQIQPRVILLDINDNTTAYIQQTQKPTPPINGNITVKFNGSLLISFPANTDSIYNYFSSIPGLDRSFYCDRVGYPMDSHQYIIEMKGIVGSIPVIEVYGNSMTGGQTKPMVTISKIIQESNNTFYAPIPSDMLYTIGNGPQIVVRSKNIISKCKENVNCSYQVNPAITPILQNFTVTSSGLDIILSNYQNVSIIASTTSIKFAGSSCLITTINLPKLSCSISKTASNQLQLEAGSHKPIIHIRNIGFTLYNTSLQSQFFPLNISSLNITNGSSQGGQVLKIIGNGFPLKPTNLISVKLGSTNCQILDVSNTAITIKTPSKNDTSLISIAYNNQTSQYTGYNYDDSKTPIIMNLSPKTSSPSQKQILLISGSGFGIDKTKVRVFLDTTNIPKTLGFYELSLLNITDTQIYVVLSGGRAGSYYMRLEIDGVGSSQESQTNVSLFKYELTVTNISPNQGSIYGGTIITINGTNFSPIKNQNQVFLGDDSNNFCDIIDSGNSYIICRTRPSPSNYLDLPQKVTVTQRVQDEAICLASNCNFVFKTSISPQLILSNGVSNLIIARAGDTVQLNGTNLNADSNNYVTVTFLTGTRTTDTNFAYNANVSVQAISSTTSSIIFIMPALMQASYAFSIYVGNRGSVLIDPSVLIITPIEVYNITIDDGALDNSNKWVSRGGVRINITGNGFSNEGVLIENADYCPIYKNSTTWIYCITQRIWAINKYSVSIYRDYNTRFTCPDCNFLVNDTKSLYLTNHSVANIDLPSNFSILAYGNAFNFSQTDEIKAFLEIFDNNYNNYKYILQTYEGNVTNITSKYLTMNFSNIPNNTYRLSIYYKNTGYIYIDTPWKYIKVSALNITSQNLTSSYYGGKVMNLYGNGFPDMTISQLNNVTICGHICKLIKNNLNSITCIIPKVLSLPVINYYNIFSKETMFHKSYKIYSDSSAIQYRINDNLLSTYYESNNNYAFILFDFQDNFLLQLKELHYYPSTTRQINVFYGLIFQASNDNVTYTTLFTLNENIKTGWNYWEADSNLQAYRYYKLSSPISNHPSKLNIAEIKFYGVKFYNGSSFAGSDNTTCDTILSLSGSKFIFQGNVQYRMDNTPVVNDISPNMGPTSGGTTLTITGNSFGTNSSNVQVLIDGVQCIISVVTNQKITCITSPRPIFVQNSINISISSNIAIISNGNFSYIDRWSDPNTWGGETPPRYGDSVYIPSGQTILLDVSTPELNAVIIEGVLIFEDKDKTFDANYLICMQGRVQIGTKDQPFLSKLIITMHGMKDDKQLPEFGNKVWAFHNGILDMHGKPKKLTWTLLAKTAETGDNTITLQSPVDWSINDEIAIASTDFNHNHSECLRITKISSDFLTLTLNSSLIYRHYSSIESYPPYNFPMQAEVALLTRNILFQGHPEDLSSLRDFYGAHLMLHLPGSIGRITYSEFKYVGQGRIIGRYPIHFHQVDDASDSFVIGNSVHDSFARVVAIHNTHFLRVQRNVGYRVYGHNYFIEDGIETNNLLEENLGISTIQIWTLINTDVTAATFWITNPNNIVRRNRAAGGDWFGFWYQLENRATGASSNPDVCPDGIPLGIFKDNVAHSYNAFGLRIYEYVPRQFPCKDSGNYNLNDFYASNPPVNAVFEGFQAWRNFENGVMAEHIGAVEFRNFLIADSRLSGIQISQANFTREDLAKINGALIIGLSRNMDLDTSRYIGSVGITTPRTDNLLVNNVTFYNFSSLYNMSAFKSCSKCWHFKLKITGGKTTKFSQLTFKSVDRKIIWDGTKREVFIDLDGTFFGGNANTSITPYYPHMDGIPECSIANSSIYDSSIICDSRVQIRPIMFRNLRPQEAFRGLELRVLRIPDLKYNMSLSLTSLSNFTRVYMEKIFVDTMYTWALPFVTGYKYNVHWQDGALDFTHMNLYPTPYWRNVDKGVVLRFNYSETREDYNVSILRFDNSVTPTNKLVESIDPIQNNFTTGDMYHLNDNKLLSIGVNGKINGTIDVDPIKCLKTCPIINDNSTKESFFRLWSNVSMWNNSHLPMEGEDVVIPRAWRVILDVNTPNLAKLTIDGDLTFDSTQKTIKLTAGLIWVRLGSMYAGTLNAPYPNEIDITLTGTRTSPQLKIANDVETSSKMLAVTGSLTLYGSGVNVTWTRLAVSCNVGDNVISLSQSVDWKIGSEIVIGPSEFDYSQHEKRVIKNVSSDGKKITLDQVVKYFHFGDNGTTYQAEFGTVLDMRSAVGLLTRKIQITSDEQDNWGCNILVTQFQDVSNNNILRRGYTELDGVEISYCGHPDTERASLDIKFVREIGPSSSLTRSSIHDGYNWCLNTQSSNNITINNNIFYNCEKFLTRALLSNNFTYSNNLLIFPRERKLNPDSSLYDMVAGLDMYMDLENSNITVIGNLIQGSEGNGFVMAGTVCGDSTGFMNNHVNSIKWIGLIIAGNKSRCIEATDISISKSQYGIISNFDAAGLSLQRIILSENQVGTQLMFGREDDENRFYHNNITFIAMARPNCSKCYSLTNSCQGLIGMTIPITVISGKSIPIDKPTPIGLTSICKDAAFDQKLIMNNATFINYQLDYTKDSNANYKQCSQNYMIDMRTGEPDANSAIFSTGMKIINGDINAFAQLQEPDIQFLFWRGGCGDFNCTGEKNWLFTDIDGSLYGKPAQIIPKNLGIKHPNCKDMDSWNGRLCDGIYFGILEFQNDGADQRRRIVPPVNISSKNMFTTLNEWREWKWEGPEPLDHRLARFNGLVELNSSISLLFETVVPEELKLKMQRGRNISDYLIVSIKYERPNTVEVWNMVSQQLIKSNRVDQNIDLTQKNMSCGANIYDSNNRTITFVITNEENCILKVRTINSVKVSLHMDTTVEDFYKNNGESDFIGKISSFLGLDISRVRIVQIRSGSVIVDFMVVENKTLTNSTSATASDIVNKTDNAATDQQLIDNYNLIKSQMEATAQKLNQGVVSGELALPAKIITITTEVIVSNVTISDNNNTYNNNSNNNVNNNTINNNSNNDNLNNNTKIDNSSEDNSNTTLIILSSVSAGVILIFIIIVCCCCYKNKEGLSLIQVCFYRNKNIDTSVNQELMMTKKNWADPETPSIETQNDVFIHGKIDNYTQKYLQNK